MKRFMLGAAYGVAFGVVLRGLLDYSEHLIRIARPKPIEIRRLHR